MRFEAGLEFDAVIAGEPCHLIVKRAQLNIERQVYDYIDGPEVVGPKSMEIDLTMVVIPLRAEEIEGHRELPQQRQLEEGI